MSPASVPLQFSFELQSWSVGVQLGTVTLLALFFIALARSMRLTEVRLWAVAWLADAAALLAVFALSFLVRPEWTSPGLVRLLLMFYALGKTLYVSGLVAGARYHLLPERQLTIRRSHLLAIVAIWSVATGLFAENLAVVQLAQALMVGAVLTFGGVWVLRHPRYPRSRWLGTVLLAEGMVFLHYVPMFAIIAFGFGPGPTYVRYSSFVDAGVELMVALGILAALEGSTTSHLHSLNRELIATRDRLRDLAERDPLTALANRHVLERDRPDVENGHATIIFLDVDDFKKINDRLGHAVGDACLRRVAAALRDTFRGEDRLFRWGGDEFLVIAPGLAEVDARERINEVRRILRTVSGTAPVFTISAGIVTFSPGARLDEALRIADQRMYDDKSRHTRSSPSWV